jgi:hypothetical protein
MKTSLTTLAFVLYVAAFFPATIANSHSSSDSGRCLKVDGKIMNAPEKGNGLCKVELLYKNKIVDSVILKDGRKKFAFVLNSEKYYTIRFSMKDHLTKMVCVDTRNAKISDDDDLYSFSFETSLLHLNGSVSVNMDFADYPIAIIYLDPKTDRFSYNKEYTSHMKKDLYVTTAKN